MADVDRCPACGAPRAAGTAEGRCAACLLRVGLREDGAGLTGAAEGAPTQQLTAPHGVLDALAASVGPVPRVLLRDTDQGTEPPPLRPGSPEMPAPSDRSSRLRLLGEIARGGMWAVLKGRDEDLGRDLAVKVLLERHQDDPDLVRRFVEEAQIGGQLQHPGVVPSYELGAFADRRPYFAMKLVKGRTLAALLAERGDPSRDLPRFLGIFEQVALTVAYAHARGVIHRDLKPSNVMVGSFGEVQVMDWGLAKVLPKGGAADDGRAGKLDEQETVIATARSGGDSDAERSRAGSVMGTPSYMAPEQARGEVHCVDERADVFALGSILCEILTGGPAFTGRSSVEIQKKAARAETADALVRLDACGADAELVALVRACLAPEAEDRPRHAGAVSGRITAYLAGVQERLRDAELARVEERARRRLTTVDAAAAVLLVSMGLGGYALTQRDRAARIARAARGVGEALAQAERLRAEARASADDDPARWSAALASAEKAEALARQGDADEVRRARAASLRSDIQSGVLGIRARAERLRIDRALLADLEAIRGRRGEQEDPAGTDAEYVSAFRKAGLDPDALAVEDAGRRIAGRSEPIELAAYLDDWSAVRRIRRPEADWHRLLAVARAADPDPWRDGLRAQVASRSPEAKAALARLAEDAPALEAQPTASLLLLARALRSLGESGKVERILRRAWARHPEDFWINMELAIAVDPGDGAASEDPRWREMIRFTSAATAIRPASWMVRLNLGFLLRQVGDVEASLAQDRELVRLRPAWSPAYSNLGRALCDAGDLPAALDACREALRLDPGNYLAHNNVGNTRYRMGDLPGAIAAYREAVRMKPDFAGGHFNLGDTLREVGDLPAAVTSCREAVRLAPGLAMTHLHLGPALVDSGDAASALAEFREALRLRPDYAKAHREMVQALEALGDLTAAMDSAREAIRLGPGETDNHNILGVILGDQQKHEEAMTEYREALRLWPGNAAARVDLGLTLVNLGRNEEAVREYREAIRLRPGRFVPHANFAQLLKVAARDEEAAAELREVIRLKPDHGQAYSTLAEVLVAQDRFDEALAVLRECHKVGAGRRGWPYPSAEWVRAAEEYATMAGRLPAIAGGRERPKDQEERLKFGQLCYQTRRHAAAARLLAEALELDPKLAADLAKGHRYNAACVAALAGCGRGRDAPPDDAARTALRQRALSWLRDDLAQRSEPPEKSNDAMGAEARQMLLHWKQDPDLAGVRDATALADLPDRERSEWQALWAEVDRLLEEVKTAR